MIVIEINVDNIEMIEVESEMIRHHQYNRHTSQAVDERITYGIHFKRNINEFSRYLSRHLEQDPSL